MTTTLPPPRRITPTSKPIAPCWVWDTHSSTRGWRLFHVSGGDWHPDYTHWIPVSLTPPTEPPDTTCEREVARLKGELEAAEQHVKILTDALHGKTFYQQQGLTWSGKSKVQKVHPWKAADVPLGCWLQFRELSKAELGYREPMSFTLVRDTGLETGRGFYSFDSLAIYWNHSTDGGKTWSPAGEVAWEDAP